MKRLLIFIAIAISAQSCVKDKSEYYLDQERDPNVIGIWMYDNGEEDGMSYEEYTADGRIYSGKNVNGIITWDKQKDYWWYTKNGILYTYVYYGQWVNDRKHQCQYYLSEDKTLLYIMYTNISPPMTRTTFPE